MGTSYALGAIVYSTTYTTKNGSSQGTSRADNFYEWWDGAVQSKTDYKPKQDESTKWESYYSYDKWGVLTDVVIDDERDRVITFINNLDGQILRRDETTYRSGGEPHEVWYRFGGKEMGYVGNNGTVDSDYAASIQNRYRAPAYDDFRYGESNPTPYSDFSQSLDPITSYQQGGSGGS